MAYVSVDIELDDIDTRYLIEELEGRYLNEYHQKDLINIIKDNDGGKLEFFLSVKDDFSLFELQELLKIRSEQKEIPKEQLTLELK